MARTQARILVSIWSNEDFLELPRRVQGTYFFLISQPNLNHAGLLPLTVKRWARTAGGESVEAITDDLEQLSAADFVVIDHDTEELLIRTLVRNDGVWKQPKVMLAMKADAGEIVSPLLRYKLREELLRIDITELEKEDTRIAVGKAIQDTLGTLPDTPPQGYPIPHEKANEYPHACAGAHSSASTSASTTTSATGLAAHAEPQDDPTSALLLEHVAAYDQPPPPSAIVPIKREVMRLVAEHVEPERIRAGLARLRERRLAASLLPQLVTETTPTRKASTTDQRVADGLALAARYEAEESA